MQNKGSKTVILSIAGIAVFVIGAIAAFFFLTRNGDGKSFFIGKNSVEAAPSQTQASVTSFEKNDKPLTEEFFKFLVKEGAERNFSAEDFGQEGFMKHVVLPYVEEQSLTLLPTVADIDVKSDENTDPKVYLENMTNYYILMMGSWQKILKEAMSTGEMTESARSDFEELLKILALGEEEIINLPVPPAHVEFHKKSIVLIKTIQLIISDGLMNGDDPLRSLLLISQMEAVGLQGRELALTLSVMREGYDF